jgi:hypothetical protein
MDGMNKMGTRAVYFFEDDDGMYGVYKHYDGYPLGAAHHIEAAKYYAWKFPRFEADEFASAFVAANKPENGGEIRLLPLFEHASTRQVMEDHRWCDFYYRISFDKDIGDLVVHTFESYYDDDVQETLWKLVNFLPHKQMVALYARAS